MIPAVVNWRESTCPSCGVNLRISAFIADQLSRGEIRTGTCGCCHSPIRFNGKTGVVSDMSCLDPLGVGIPTTRVTSEEKCSRCGQLVKVDETLRIDRKTGLVSHPNECPRVENGVWSGTLNPRRGR